MFTLGEFRAATKNLPDSAEICAVDHYGAPESFEKDAVYEPMEHRAPEWVGKVGLRVPDIGPYPD